MNACHTSARFAATACFTVLLAGTICFSKAEATQKAADKPVAAKPMAPVDAPAQAVVGAPTASQPVVPQKMNGATPAWTVTCVSRSRAVAADCTLEQRLFSKESERLLSVAVVSVPGATCQPSLVMQLPTGLAVQDGVSMSIDEAAPKPLALQSCDGRGCFATLPITPDVLEAMKGGKVMTVKAMSAAREPLAFQHLLTDFAGGYESAQ